MACACSSRALNSIPTGAFVRRHDAAGHSSAGDERRVRLRHPREMASSDVADVCVSLKFNPVISWRVILLSEPIRASFTPETDDSMERIHLSIVTRSEMPLYTQS